MAKDGCESKIPAFGSPQNRVVDAIIELFAWLAGAGLCLIFDIRVGCKHLWQGRKPGTLRRSE